MAELALDDVQRRDSNTPTHADHNFADRTNWGRVAVVRDKVLRTSLSLAVVGLLTLAGAAPAGAAESPTLAGYQTTQTGFDRASTVFAVPTVTCPTPADQMTITGIGNNDASEGDPMVIAGVQTSCTSGFGSHSTIAFITNQPPAFGSASAGDRVKVTIRQTATSAIAMVKNLTTGELITVTGSPRVDDTLLFGSFPLPLNGTPDPVPDFDRISMRAPMIDGTLLADLSPLTRLRRVESGVTKIGVSSLNPASSAFSLKFLAN